MDSDSFIPQFWRATRIIGLEKLVAKKIEAEGVKLREAESAEPLSKFNFIEWFKEGAKQSHQFIFAYYEAINKIHYLQFVARSEEGSEKNAVFTLSATDNFSAAPELSALAFFCGPFSKTLFNGKGQSSFLQLSGLEKRTIALGTASMTQTAGSHFLNPLLVNHSLPNAATICVATADNAAINISAIPNASATQIELRGYNNFGTEALTTNVRWIAIA